jgi:hypothetical protein
MNINTFLQSIITLIFIYLLLSLVASEVQENISAVFELRARRLKQSIQKMLGETNSDHYFTDKLYEHSSISTLNQSASSLTSLILGISFNILTWEEWKKNIQIILSPIIWIVFFISILFQWHILVKILLFILVIICRLSFKPENGEISRKSIGPSYIESETFVKAMISIIKDSHIIPENSKDIIDDNPIKYLKNLGKEFDLSSKKLSQIVADNDGWDKFEKIIENLYKEVQERSTGVYKRNAKGLSLILGMTIAIISNADVFNIIQILNKSSKGYENQLISKLEKEEVFSKARVKDPSVESLGDELNAPEKEKISAIIQEVGLLPLGWNYDQKLDKELKKQQLKAEDQELVKSEEIIQILETSQPICAKKEENFNTKKGEDSNAKKEEDSSSKYDWQKCLGSLNDSFEDKPELIASLPKDFKEQVKSLYKSDVQGQFPTTYNNYNKNLVQKVADSKAKKIFNDSSKSGIAENTLRNTTGANNKDWIKQIQSWWGKTKILVEKQGGWPTVLFGWFVSAVAIAMGAPFWFDMLRKIMNFRSTGQEIRNKKLG